MDRDKVKAHREAHALLLKAIETIPFVPSSRISSTIGGFRILVGDNWIEVKDGEDCWQDPVYKYRELENAYYKNVRKGREGREGREGG